MNQPLGILPDFREVARKLSPSKTPPKAYMRAEDP